MPERIAFNTKDGVTIVGTWNAPRDAEASVLLLHMWPSDRSSWTSFQERLALAHLASFAIDLRGHGESGGEAGDDARSMKEDVEAALAWLAEKPISPRVIVGASIGANLAIRALADHAEIASAVLLSPGIEYHRVTTLDVASRISPQQAVYIAASAGDDQVSADASQAIHDVVSTGQKTLRLLQNADHGTRMFERDPGLPDEIVQWIMAHR